MFTDASTLAKLKQREGICLVIYKDLSSPKTKLEQKLNNKNAYFDFFFFFFYFICCGIVQRG